jgi:hypothetical protein
VKNPRHFAAGFQIFIVMESKLGADDWMGIRMSERLRFRAWVTSMDAPPRATTTTVDVEALDADEARRTLETMIGGGSRIERLERLTGPSPEIVAPSPRRRRRSALKAIRRPHDASDEFDDADYDGGVSGGHFLHVVIGIVVAIIVIVLLLRWLVPGAL